MVQGAGTRPGPGGAGGSEGGSGTPQVSPQHGRRSGGAGESGSPGPDARPQPGLPAPSADPSPARSGGDQELAASPHHQRLPAQSQPRGTRHESALAPPPTCTAQRRCRTARLSDVTRGRRQVARPRASPRAPAEAPAQQA